MNYNPLVIANWKMNPLSASAAAHLFRTIAKEAKRSEGAEIVFCPPFVWLHLLPKAKRGLFLGAQDCFWENKGAYTGEISPLMLKNAGCQYVLVGHSERRKYFQEDDAAINKKIKAVLKVRLRPVLCVGEEARDAFNAEGKLINELSLIIGEQLEKGLAGISAAQARNIVVAYEPVWAIGTGAECSYTDAMKAALYIRKVLAKIYDRALAEKARVLYGGSVDSAGQTTAAGYIKEAGLDGLLVGGSSLDASEFIRIIKSLT